MRSEGAPAGGCSWLRPAAAELYGDLRLEPLLRRLLDQSGRLLGVVAGSVSLVSSTQDRYTKAAERGASCRLGQTFPLDEGITGRVTAGRGPVVLRSYEQVRRGHLPQEHPARRGAVAAVPIWWLGRVIGVNVVFAGCDRRFQTREVDQLELLSQVGAAGIVASTQAEPPRGTDDLQPRRRVQESAAPSDLTPREQEVLALLAEGLTDRQVADSLQLSHKTVEKHVGAVLRKTGTTSRTGAVVRALQRGWLPLAAQGEPRCS